MNLRRLFGAFALALTTMFVLAVPASAHAVLESSSPADNATLSVAPITIKLTFNENVTLQPQPFKVTGRDGTEWRVGKPTITDKTVSVPVTPAGPAQAYTITYKIISDDGDNQTGTLHFTLTAAAAPGQPAGTAPTGSAAAPTSSAAESGTPASSSVAASSSSAAPSPAPAAADSSGSGLPAWVWILIVVVLVLAAGAVALRFLKGRGAGTGPGDGEND